MNALLRFIDPHRRLRPLPPPDPRCKTYDFGGTVQLIRNHAEQMRKSRELYATTSAGR